MSDPEITALAREYAEEKANTISFKAYADPDFKKELYTKGCANDAKEVIEWLLRRYALVEKTKIKAIYRDKSEIYYCDFHNRDTVLREGSQVELLESLFPEIAKEVEG